VVLDRFCRTICCSEKFYYICLFTILTLIMDSGFNSIKDIFDSLIVAASLILSLMSLKKMQFIFTFIKSEKRKLMTINII